MSHLLAHPRDVAILVADDPAGIPTSFDAVTYNGAGCQDEGGTTFFRGAYECHLTTDAEQWVVIAHTIDPFAWVATYTNWSCPTETTTSADLAAAILTHIPAWVDTLTP